MTEKTLNMQAWILQIIYQDFLALGKGLYCAHLILLQIIFKSLLFL